MRGTPLLLMALLASPPLAAEEGDVPGGVSPAAQPAPAAPLGPTVTADLRDDYLAGQRLIVNLTVKNETSAPLDFPDLSARPWLVKFGLTPEGGKAQTHSNTTPASDAGQQVRIAARGQRKTVLEIPGGAALKPGSYTLVVTVETPTGPLVVSERQIRLGLPKPIAGDLGAAPPAGPGRTIHDLWLQQGGAGYDLYLNEADPKAPSTTVASWYLATIPHRVSPSMTVARPSDAGNRFLSWATDDRHIQLARLVGTALREAPTTVESPWPKIEIAGRGVTDGRGQLALPVWVPSPKGVRGELRLLTLSDRGLPIFRRVALLDARPTGVVSTVDDAGTAHFIVWRPDFIDIYSVRDGASSATDEPLPVPGRRIARGIPGEDFVAVRFAILPESSSQAGGLAIQALATKEGQLLPRWISLKGEAIQALAPTPMPAGSALVDFLPDGDATPGLLTRGADGRVSWRSGAQVVPISDLGPAWSLQRDQTGAAVLRSLTATGGPISIKELPAGS